MDMTQQSDPEVDRFVDAYRMEADLLENRLVELNGERARVRARLDYVRLLLLAVERLETGDPGSPSERDLTHRLVSFTNERSAEADKSPYAALFEDDSAASRNVAPHSLTWQRSALNQWAASAIEQTDRMTADAHELVRTPSTTRVAQVVSAQNRFWTRDEVMAAYADAYGFPPSWSNPRNAINNALARAVKRNLIAEHGDRFAPLHVAAGLTLEMAQELGQPDP